MKKVVIIGGGIAGLSAGVYAQKCGFDVTILESHDIPGGNCTSWRRGDYLFEGGMHWLTGSRKGDAVNGAWRHIGALNDRVAVHYPEPFMEYQHEGTPIRLYRDIEKTESHLLALSPDDEKEIKRLCSYIRKVGNIAMPVTDLRGVKVTKKKHIPVSLMFSAISALRLMRKFTKISRQTYINRFTHQGIRELIRSATSDKVGVLPLFFTMGTLSRGDGGFPEGGSLPFAGRIAETFVELGGEIRYKTRAEKVIVEDGRVTGVMAGEERLPADAVIVTADTMAMDHLFDVPPKAAWLDEMRQVTEPTMATFISLGINADLKQYPKTYILDLEQPIKLGEQTYEFLSLNNYATDKTYSAEGKTAMTIILDGDTYDFWKAAKEEGTYSQEKQKIADEIIKAVMDRIPEAKGKIEVTDVATPLTYERYCSTWKGSWMTEMTSKMKMKSYPATAKDLAGVYFAGHRMMPPGGLPVALMSGREAVQYLCRDTDTLFISED